MKLFLVALFSSIVLSANGCEDYLDACDDIADIATITCTPDDTAFTCKIAVADGYGNGNQTLDNLVDGLTSIDADTCREKCKEQADQSGTKCKFFKFQKGHTDLTCSLQTTCGTGDQYCGKPDCVSGELGCDDEGNEIKNCPLTKATPWDPTKFHIICTNDHDGDVNIYDDAITADYTVPADTICSTVRMCDTWADQDVQDDPALFPYYRKLAIMCNGATGAWEARIDTGDFTLSGDMIVEENKIAEQECPNRCKDLPLSAKQPWADLICDLPLKDGNTLADSEDDGTNSCILLCDNHMHLSIDCGFTGNGEKHWHDIHGEVLTDAKIVCPD